MRSSLDNAVCVYARRAKRVPKSELVEKLYVLRQEIVTNLLAVSVALFDTQAVLFSDGELPVLINELKQYYSLMLEVWSIDDIITMPPVDRTPDRWCYTLFRALDDSYKELHARCQADAVHTFNSVLTRKEQALYSIDDLEELPGDISDRVMDKFDYEKKHVWMLAYSTITLMLKMAECVAKRDSAHDVIVLCEEIEALSSRAVRPDLPDDTWMGLHLKTLNLCLMVAIGDVDTLDWRSVSTAKTVAILAQDLISGYWVSSQFNPPILAAGYSTDYHFDVIAFSLWHTLREVLTEGDGSAELMGLEWAQTAIPRFREFSMCSSMMELNCTNAFVQQGLPGFVDYYLNDMLNAEVGDNLHPIIDTLFRLMDNNCGKAVENELAEELLQSYATYESTKNLQDNLRSMQYFLAKVTSTTFAVLETLQCTSATQQYLPESNEPTQLHKWFASHLLSEKVVTTLCAFYCNETVLKKSNRVAKVTEMAIWAILAIITHQRKNHPFYRLTQHLFSYKKPAAPYWLGSKFIIEDSY